MLSRRLLSLTAGCTLIAASGAWAQEVVWDSPPNNDLTAFRDQQYGDFPDFSIYLVAHISLDRAYFIHDITTYFTNLNNLWPLGNINAALNIYNQVGGLPDNADVPQQAVVTANLAAAANGFSLTVSLDGDLVLEAGDYWIGLTPSLEFGAFGSEFHQGTDEWDKNTAGRNPGGGYGVGTEWFDAGQLFAGIDWGMAITVTGEDCPWDLDGNGTVGATDLLSLLVTWGPCACNDCPADFDGNCFVGATDLLALLVNWGPCP